MLFYFHTRRGKKWKRWDEMEKDEHAEQKQGLGRNLLLYPIENICTYILFCYTFSVTPTGSSPPPQVPVAWGTPFVREPYGTAG